MDANKVIPVAYVLYITKCLYMRHRYPLCSILHCEMADHLDTTIAPRRELFNLLVQQEVHYILREQTGVRSRDTRGDTAEV